MKYFLDVFLHYFILIDFFLGKKTLIQGPLESSKSCKVVNPSPDPSISVVSPPHNRLTCKCNRSLTSLFTVNLHFESHEQKLEPNLNLISDFFLAWNRGFKVILTPLRGVAINSLYCRQNTVLYPVLCYVPVLPLAWLNTVRRSRKFLFVVSFFLLHGIGGCEGKTFSYYSLIQKIVFILYDIGKFLLPFFSL